MNTDVTRIVRILVVDDDENIRDIFHETLIEDLQYEGDNQDLTDLEGKLFGDKAKYGDQLELELISCTQGPEAVEEVRRSKTSDRPFSIAFIDVKMPPGPDGIWTAQEIRKLDQDIEIVIVTGYADVQPDEFRESLKPIHKTLFVRKPFYPQELKQFVLSLTEKRFMETELRLIKKKLEEKVETREKELVKLNQELIHDIEERRKTEQELKRFKMVMDQAGDIIFISDPKTARFIDFNEQSCKQLGYTKEEYQSLTAMDITSVFPDLRSFQKMAEDLRKLPGQIKTVNDIQNRKDGTVFPVEVTVALRTIEGEEYMLTTLRDMTERKRLIRELSDSKDHLAAAQQIAHVGSWEWYIDQEEMTWSAETYRIFGSNPGEHALTLKIIEERIHQGDIAKVNKHLREVIKNDIPYDIEHRLVMPDNSIKHVRIRGQVERNKDGIALKMVGTAQDITQRKTDEQEKQRLRGLLSNIINSMPSILIGVDTKGIVSQWNQEAQKLTGLSSDEAIGRSLESVIPDFASVAEMLKQTIQTEKTIKESKISIEKDEETYLYDIVTYPLIADFVEGAVVLIENVTDKARMEEILLQTEKMFTVGGLAAGMAHEINSPLAGIIQNLQVVRNRLTVGVPQNELIAKECGTSIESIEAYLKKRKLSDTIHKVLEAGQRAARIVENMLNFSYKAGTVYSRHDIAALLDKTIELANNEYDLKKKFDFRQIIIQRDYSPDVQKVPCEGNMIQQVFFNILKNGAYAMARSRTKIKAPMFRLKVEQIEKKVRVQIEDNGPGMDELTQKRIFEPFFTTKEVGVGTGLGLAVSYFIITENHGGTITVESTPGKGARFIISLPI